MARCGNCPGIEFKSKKEMVQHMLAVHNCTFDEDADETIVALSQSAKKGAI